DSTQTAKTQPARKVTGALNRDAPHRSTPRRKEIAKAKIAAKVNSKTDRSAAFQSAVNAAARAGMTTDQIEAEMRKHPAGPQQKYLRDGRLRQEIDRSFEKVEQQQKQRDKERVQRVKTGKRIDGAQLLDQVYEFTGRFICYPNKEARIAHALWIARTHMMNVWETTPRLAFLSPEPFSGKTRALEVTELLVPRPVPAQSMFRPRTLCVKSKMTQAYRPYCSTRSMLCSAPRRERATKMYAHCLT